MMLVLGADGQIGSSVMSILGEGTVGWTRRDLDLTDRNAIVPSIVGVRPDGIVNCAAYTQVDTAESDTRTAFAVNSAAVGQLAVAARRLSVPFITISTDYVFDGRGKRPYVETDTPNPLNVYGSSKLAGEIRAEGEYPDTCIVRTSWVYSATHPNFARAISSRILAGETVRVVNDQVGTPTHADHVARVIGRLIDEPVNGIVHVSEGVEMSWYEFARRIAAALGFEPDVCVVPRATSDEPVVAQRPEYSALASIDPRGRAIMDSAEFDASLRHVAGLLREQRG